MLDRSRTAGWVVALIVVLFAITNLPWQLDDYDQAKQAFTSFEMVEQGHWFYEHTPNEKIATKPPLVGWISAASYAVTGSWDFAWRLPSFAAALVLLGAITLAANRAYGASAAILAAAAFGFNLLAPRLATLVRTDMPLALVVFLLGLKIWEKIRRAEPWLTSDRVTMCALLIAAMLIKGPIVYAFLLPGIVAFQWSRRGLVGGGSAWCGWWPWFVSLAIFLLWVAGGIAWVPQFYEQVILREFLGRFGETIHRPQPIYFYLPHLLHKFAPWSFLLIGFAVVLWRKREPLTPEIRWLLFWSLGGLLVMSLIPSKRVDRIFPIFPPLALLLAALFDRLTKAVPTSRVRPWCVAALGIACLFTSGYAAWKIVTGYQTDSGALARFGAAVRNEAAARGWKYEVIGGKEEGMLLYLRRTRFLPPEEAIADWKSGALNALVAPVEDLPRLRAELPDIQVGPEAAITINNQPRRYLLLRRE